VYSLFYDVVLGNWCNLLPAWRTSFSIFCKAGLLAKSLLVFIWEYLYVIFIFGR
jgi:hypothetical protein